MSGTRTLVASNRPPSEPHHRRNKLPDLPITQILLLSVQTPIQHHLVDTACGRAIVDGTTGDSFTVSTSVETQSIVTFRDIEIKNSTARGISAAGGSEVTLEGMWIHLNAGGVSTLSGAFLDINRTLFDRNVGPDDGAIQTSLFSAADGGKFDGGF